MKPKVTNRRHRTTSLPPPGTVYVGRPSKWGNPFIVGTHGDRDEVIRKYKKWLMKQPELLKCLRYELHGQDLECWCAPQRCHADVLLKMANT